MAEEKHGIGAPEVLGSGIVGTATAAGGTLLAKRQNAINYLENMPDYAAKAQELFKQQHGTDFTVAYSEAINKAKTDLGNSLHGADSSQFTKKLKESAHVQEVLGKYEAIQASLVPEAEELAKKAMSLKGGQIAGITLGTLAAVGLTAYGINKIRNHEKPSAHIDAATAQVATSRVQEAQMQNGMGGRG